jgi:hypothetical protein
MANSTINFANEQRCQGACSLINKLKRLGLLTDALVAAATSFQDLLDDIASALVVSGTTNDKYPPIAEQLVRYLLAELSFLNSIGQLSDSNVTSLTTVNTASAGTDLRYRFSSLVTDASFDPAREDYIEAAFGASSYSANL